MAPRAALDTLPQPLGNSARRTQDFIFGLRSNIPIWEGYRGPGNPTTTGHHADRGHRYYAESHLPRSLLGDGQLQKKALLPMEVKMQLSGLKGELRNECEEARLGGEKVQVSMAKLFSLTGEN